MNHDAPSAGRLLPTAPPDLRPGAAPTVAVLIAAHDNADTIAECLDSVFAQTSPASEVIVCDDGSTDDLTAALAPYRDKVVVLTQPNRGEGGAKESARRAATSEFVAYLDADDRFEPTRLEVVRGLLAERPDLDVVATEVHEFGPSARGDNRLSSWFTPDDARTMILRANALPVFVARRRLLDEVGGFATDESVFPDWVTSVRLVFGGARVGLVVEPLYAYRRWAGQTTAGRRRYYERRLRTFESFARELPLTDAERAAVTEGVHATYDKLLEAERADGGVTRATAWQVLRHAPSTRRRARAALDLATLAVRPLRAFVPRR